MRTEYKARSQPPSVRGLPRSKHGMLKAQDERKIWLVRQRDSAARYRHFVSIGRVEDGKILGHLVADGQRVPRKVPICARAAAGRDLDDEWGAPGVFFR